MNKLSTIGMILASFVMAMMWALCIMPNANAAVVVARAAPVVARVAPSSVRSHSTSTSRRPAVVPTSVPISTYKDDDRKKKMAK